MASQVLLVIVVFAAGIVIAAAIFLRAGKRLHSGNTGKDASAGHISDFPAVSSPASPDEALPATVGPGAPAADPCPLASLHAPRVAASASTVPGDASELEFTLETVPAAAPEPRACAPAATPPPSATGGGSATPQVLQPAEIFAKLFDLALGKARPASTVTAGHI